MQYTSKSNLRISSSFHLKKRKICRFLRKSKLSVPEDVSRAVKDGLRAEGHLTGDIFNKMQHEALQIIDQTTYRSFLQSDLYLQFINRNARFVSSNSSSSEEPSTMISRSSLPTLHEDSELVNYDSNFGLSSSCGASMAATTSTGPSSIPMTLTRDALMATQQRRLEMRPTR